MARATVTTWETRRRRAYRRVAEQVAGGAGRQKKSRKKRRNIKMPMGKASKAASFKKTKRRNKSRIQAEHKAELQIAQ